MDSFLKQPYRVTLKDQAIADDALAGMPEPYRRLDTAVLEALVLRGALGMSEDDISHLRGLDYSKNLERRASSGWSPGARTPASSCAPRRSSRCARWRRRASRCRRSPPTSSRRSPPASCSIRSREDLHAQGRRRHHRPLVRRPRAPSSPGRPEAYGSVDEAASALGLARAAAERGGELYDDILRFQNELFVAGAELATAPEAAGRLEAGVSKVTPDMVERLESDIDRYMERVDLPPKFVIPGGTELSARLDVARAAVRRAERRVAR